MTLYHFCPKWMLPGILKDGLTKGTIVEIHGENVLLKHGFQWMTCNPCFDQSWEAGSSLPYRRNEIRLSIDTDTLPSLMLFRWLDYCLKNPNPMHEDLNAFGDPWNWYVYAGNIDPVAIVDITENPSAVMTLANQKRRYTVARGVL